MELQERTKLKERYAAMPEEELIAFLLVDKEEYQPEAHKLLCMEAKKRGLEEKVAALQQANKEPVEATLESDELKSEKYVVILIVADIDDKDFLESTLDKKGIPYMIESLSLKGNTIPASLAIEESKVGETVEILKDFQPKSGIILW